MAVNGISDLVSTICVPKSEYEELIRTSERMECVMDYIENSDIVMLGQIKSILGIKKEEDKNESVSD